MEPKNLQLERWKRLRHFRVLEKDCRKINCYKCRYDFDYDLLEQYGYINSDKDKSIIRR